MLQNFYSCIESLHLTLQDLHLIFGYDIKNGMCVRNKVNNRCGVVSSLMLNNQQQEKPENEVHLSSSFYVC